MCPTRCAGGFEASYSGSAVTSRSSAPLAVRLEMLRVVRVHPSVSWIVQEMLKGVPMAGFVIRVVTVGLHWLFTVADEYITVNREKGVKWINIELLMSVYSRGYKYFTIICA